MDAIQKDFQEVTNAVISITPQIGTSSVPNFHNPKADTYLLGLDIGNENSSNLT